MTTTTVTGWYDVQFYGAVPGNTSDAGTNVTKINTAIAAIAAVPNGAGGVLYFPPGTYYVSGALRTLPPNTTVMGCGCETSIVSCTSTTAAIFVVAAVGGVPASGIAFQEIGIAYESNATGGAAILFEDATDVRITDVEISGAYYGLYVYGVTTGNANFYCERMKIRASMGSGAGVYVFGAPSAADSTRNRNLHFTDCVILGTSPSNGPLYGYYFENAYQVFMLNCNQQYGAYHGIVIFPSSGYDATTDMWISNCSWDGNLHYACYIGPNTGLTSAPVRNINFLNCAFSNTATNYGVAVMAPATGYALAGINFTDCLVRGSAEHGICVSYASRVQIINCNVYGNGTAASNTYAGILVEGSANVMIASCLVNALGTPTGTAYQKYGIYIYTGCTNISVIGCDASGNDTAGILVAPGGGASCFISNNVGYNPIGVIPTSVAPSFPTVSPSWVQNTLGTTASVYISGDIDNAWLGPSSSSWEELLNCATGAAIRVDPGQYLKIEFPLGPPLLSWRWVLD